MEVLTHFWKVSLNHPDVTGIGFWSCPGGVLRCGEAVHDLTTPQKSSQKFQRGLTKKNQKCLLEEPEMPSEIGHGWLPCTLEHIRHDQKLFLVIYRGHLNPPIMDLNIHGFANQGWIHDFYMLSLLIVICFKPGYNKDCLSNSVE